MDHIERNYRIIEGRMKEQMEESLAFGKKLIEKELDVGLFNFIVKPVIKTFYDYWSENDARQGTLQQIKVALDCGKILLNNGATKENFEKLIEDYFPKYLEGDQTSRQCKKNHKNYTKLVEITKDTFISQIQELVFFLQVQKDVKNYEELTVAAMKSKETAHDALMRQMNYNDEAIKIVEKDPSILKIPTGRNIILKILRKGFDETKKELLQNIEDWFNKIN